MTGVDLVVLAGIGVLCIAAAQRMRLKMRQADKPRREIW